VPCDIGNTLFEVLHVRASLKASDVAAHQHASELWSWSGGVPLWVADDVERIVLLTVVDSGAKAPVYNAAPHTEVHQVMGVGGGLAVGHAVEFLRWRHHAAHKEVIDVTAYDPLLLGGQHVLFFDHIACEIRQLGGMGDPHWHAHNLPSHLSAVDRVGRG